MSDMLIKLYNLDQDNVLMQSVTQSGYNISQPIGPLHLEVVDWVCKQFSARWGSECNKALNNNPISCFVATQQHRLVGFACYDATALGFFGPIGIINSCRGKGLGRALTLSCLQAMKQKGYGYAVVGGVGPIEFYKKYFNALEIPDSTPGIYSQLEKH